MVRMKIGARADKQIVFLCQFAQFGALGLGKGGVDGFKTVQSQRFQLRHVGVQPCRVGFKHQGMRPERLPAGAVHQVNRLADLQPAIRRGADSRRIIGAAWPVGANLAQRAGDAVHFQVAHLAQGEQGGVQIGVLCIEAVAEQMGFAAMEPGGHFHAG